MFHNNTVKTPEKNEQAERWKFAAKLLRLPLDPLYTGLVTTVQVLYLLEICCRGWVFIILYDEI